MTFLSNVESEDSEVLIKLLPSYVYVVKDVPKYFSSFAVTSNLTSVVASLMKGKMALTLVAEEANCRHSSRKPCLEGWALRCNRLHMNTRSLQEHNS